MAGLNTQVERLALRAPDAKAEPRAWGRPLIAGMSLVLQWMLLVSIFVLPLDPYLTLPGHDSGVFLSEVVTVEACAVLALTLVVGRAVGQRTQMALRLADLAPVGLILVAALLSIIGAASPGTGLKNCLKIGVFVGIYAVARALRNTPGIRSRALFVVLISYDVVVMFGLLASMPGVPDLLGALLNIHRQPATIPFSTVVRAESTFRYPNELAAYLLIAMSLLVAYGVKVPSRLEKTAYLLLVGMGFWLLVLTYTRGALVAALVVAPLFLFLLGGRRLGIAGLLAAATVAAVLLFSGGATGGRFLTLLSSNDSGYTTRLAVWRWAWHGFLQRPLFGVGAGNLRYQPGAPYSDTWLHLRDTDAENLYLNVLAELGVVGFVAVMACLVGALRRGWAGTHGRGTWQDRTWSIGVVGGLAVVLVYGLVDPVLISGQVTGLLCAMVGLAGGGVLVRPRTTSAPGRSVEDLRRAVWEAPDTTILQPVAPAPDEHAVWQAADSGIYHLPESAVEVFTLWKSPDTRELTLPESLTDVRALWEGPDTGILQAPAPPVRSRVVFLVNSSGYGGAEQHAINMAGELAQRGARVLVVCPPEASLIIARLETRGIPYRALSLGMNAGRWRGFLGTAALLNPLSQRRCARHLAELMAEEPSMLVCPFPREQVLATHCAAGTETPVIWIFHAFLHYLPHRLILRRMLARAAPQADAIVIYSRRLAAEMVAAGIAAQQMHFIPNAVSMYPAPGPQGEDGLAALDGLAAGALVGVACRLVKGKGVQHLIAAMPHILQYHPAAHLVIAGTGRYAGTLRRQVSQLGLNDHIHFLGHLAAPEALFRRLRVFVFPSVDPGEVCPTAILEAAGQGVPVVATAVGGIPEIVVNGQTGILTWPADAGDLAKAIIALLSNSDRAHAMGEAGRELVRSRFALPQAASGFASLLAVAESSHTVSGPDQSASGHIRAVQRPRLLGNTALLLASKVLTALGTAWWTILAARTLLPAAYGNLMLCVGLIDLGAIITDAGLTTVATRDLAQAYGEEVRVLTGALFYLKLALGLAATALTVGLAFMLPFDPVVRSLMFVLGPSLLFVSLNSLGLLFRARQSLWYAVGIAVVVALFTVGGSWIVYVRHANIAAFAEVRLGAAVAAGLLTCALITWRFRPRFRVPVALLRRLLVTAIPLGVALVLNVFYYRIDVPLLALLANSTQVAIYTSAYRILDVITLLPVSAAGVALALMASLMPRGRRYLAEFARQYLELALACGLFIGVTLTIFGGHILQALYAGRYDASGRTLEVLAWAGAATLVTNVFMPLAIVLDRRHAVLMASAVGLAVNVALNLWLIPWLGAVGPAYATLVTELAVTAPLAWVTIRALPWRVRGVPLVAPLLATGAAFLANHLLYRSGVPWWLAGAAALALWAVTVAVMVPGWIKDLVFVTSRGGRMMPAMRRESDWAGESLAATEVRE